MEWLAVTIVGFLAATAMVIALARRTTARWEREARPRPSRRRSTPRTLRTRRVRRQADGDRTPTAR